MYGRPMPVKIPSSLSEYDIHLNANLLYILQKQTLQIIIIIIKWKKKIIWTKLYI